MNRYAYVNGNPISLADPFGLSPSLKWLGHAALDALGMIPGFGCMFDVANSIWYFSEGDIFGGVCSAISSIPGLGDAIGGAVMIVKYTKAASMIMHGSKVIGNSGRLIKGSYVVGNVIKNNIDRYAIRGEKFSLSQFGVDVFTVGLEALSIKGAIKGLKSSQADFKASMATFNHDVIDTNSKIKTQTLFSGERSSVSPDVAFEQGFISKGTHNNLDQHVTSNTTAGNFISTTSEKGIAEQLAGKNGYVYEIQTSNYVDVNKALGAKSPFPEQIEFSIPGGVNPSQIKGAWVMKSGQLTNEFIPNPGFTGGK